MPPVPRWAWTRVREFRVEVNAYSAEFGRNSGGQVNVLTKSGTNRFGGSAFEYHRNDSLDSKNYFDTQGKPDFTRNQFGGTFGGPIARNRTFFFVGYEGLIERLGRRSRPSSPTTRTKLASRDPSVAPSPSEFPVANGPLLGQGLATFTLPFNQTLNSVSSRDGLTITGRGPTRHSYATHWTTQPVSTDRLPAISAHLYLEKPVLHG